MTQPQQPHQRLLDNSHTDTLRLANTLKQLIHHHFKHDHPAQNLATFLPTLLQLGQDSASKAFTDYISTLHQSQETSLPTPPVPSIRNLLHRNFTQLTTTLRYQQAFTYHLTGKLDLELLNSTKLEDVVHRLIPIMDVIYPDNQLFTHRILINANFDEKLLMYFTLYFPTSYQQQHSRLDYIQTITALLDLATRRAAHYYNNPDDYIPDRSHKLALALHFISEFATTPLFEPTLRSETNPVYRYIDFLAN